MSSVPQPLNSNPEVLLRKRRNLERTRLEKQELAKKRMEEQKKLKNKSKNRFVRAESIVATNLATQREKERIKRISILEHKKSRNLVDHLPSDRDFIMRVTPLPESEIDDDDEDSDGLLREKIVYDGKPTLLFIVRMKGPTNTKIPHKAYQVLELLRLQNNNTGVFFALTPTTYPLLKLVAPYVVTGRPSPNSVRSLIQKRSRILHQREDETEPHPVVLNDNNIVEQRLGEEGIICIEDIIHEIVSLGDSFSTCNFFLLPFELTREVSGFGALNRLRKIKNREWQQKTRKVSNASTAPITEIDIDALISQIN